MPGSGCWLTNIIYADTMSCSYYYCTLSHCYSSQCSLRELFLLYIFFLVSLVCIHVICVCVYCIGLLRSSLPIAQLNNLCHLDITSEKLEDGVKKAT